MKEYYLKIQKKKGWAFLLFSILLMGNVTLMASEKPPYIKHKPSIANDILESAYRYVGSLDRFSLDAFTINDDIQDGMIVEVKQVTKVLVDRP